MHGTRKLFSMLLPCLNSKDIKIVPLPSSGPQNYEQLKEFVKTQLPHEDYILVAESFSGPIAVLLAQERTRGLKALVFVATFVSPPNKLLLSLAEFLPIKMFMKLPFSSLVVRAIMLGPHASKNDVSALKEAIDEVPAKALRLRLRTMRSLSLPRERSSIPCVYIRPTSDRLIPSRKVAEMHEFFGSLLEREISGPHFVLQANPRECSTIINDVAQSFNKALKNDA